jgi:hypothetical protein
LNRWGRPQENSTSEASLKKYKGPSEAKDQGLGVTPGKLDFPRDERSERRHTRARAKREQGGLGGFPPGKHDGLPFINDGPSKKRARGSGFQESSDSLPFIWLLLRRLHPGGVWRDIPRPERSETRGVRGVSPQESTMDSPSLNDGPSKKRDRGVWVSPQESSDSLPFIWLLLRRLQPVGDGGARLQVRRGGQIHPDHCNLMLWLGIFRHAAKFQWTVSGNIASDGVRLSYRLIRFFGVG